MANIKVITSRRPWASTGPLELGAEVEVSDEDAAALVANGFAELVDAPAPPSRRRPRSAQE